MRRLLAFALVLALVPAAAAATKREQPVAGPISSASITGTEIAYSDEYRTRCHEIRLWDVATRSDKRLASHCFVSTSTGSGVAGAIATGGRALWLTYIGGNTREWSLWTKGANAKARRIAFLAADGLSRGFRPGEKTALALIWFMPLIARTVAEYTLIPLGVPMMLLVLGLALHRAADEAGLLTRWHSTAQPIK